MSVEGTPFPMSVERAAGTAERATWRSKTGLAENLKGGVIMDVVTPEQAVVAAEAGAVAVMALERVLLRMGIGVAVISAKMAASPGCPTRK